MKCPNLWQSLTLVLFHRACKTFQVGGISTFAASIFLLVCTSGVKGPLVEACLLLLSTFVLYGPWLGLGFHFWFLSCSSSVHWCLMRWIWVACISPATCLICLAVAIELSYFFCNLMHLACWKLVQVYTAFLWPWTQILCHTERTSICPYARCLLSQVGSLPDWSELVHRCTIHPHFWTLVEAC